MSDGFTIFQEVSEFLKDRKITKVWFITGSEKPHTNAFQTNSSRICLVLSGTYEFEVRAHGRSEVASATSGEVIFIPACCWDAPTWRQPCRIITFTFTPRQIFVALSDCQRGDQAKTTTKLGIPCYLKNEGKLMEDALNEMALINRTSPAAPCLSEAMIRHGLHILTADNIITSRAKNRWETICLYLQENFGPQITRDSVANTFALTPNHLSRLFQQEGNSGFNTYLNSVRINQTKRILSDHSFNLDEIAEKVGFKSGDYLGRVFRKSTGHTPGEYRTKYTKSREHEIYSPDS